MMQASRFALNREIEAAKLLRDQLSDLVADDPDFLHTALEGETDLFEQIDALVLSVRHDEALAQGTADLARDLQGRKRRLEERAEIKRALIASALDLAALRKRETPAGTVTLKVVPPKAIIHEEAEIPARFWEPQPPKLSLRALTEALKAREAARAQALAEPDPSARSEALRRVDETYPAIAGAALSNGGHTVQIR
jgi:hypothetical protein